MTTVRPYQLEAENAVWSYWRDGGKNPLVEMATGTGKSVLVARINRGAVENWPDMRVLNLVHVRELVEQNAMALLRQWPAAPLGVNSASLRRRDTRSQILYAGIHSVYRKARQIGPFDLVWIDEAHLIPPDGEGMYRRLLDDLRAMTPDMRIGGCTATPFRMKSGRLDGGDGALFSSTVYEYGIGRAIEDGWLAPLTSKAGEVQIDTSRVPKVGGEFQGKALEEAAIEVTRAALAEIITRGQDRRSWLLFCSGVEHALLAAEMLRAAGIKGATITGETPSTERSRLVADFRAGRLRYLTNANVLTTGFDAPGVDLIGSLRPTLSPSLYIQMMGRGTRPIWPAGFDPNEATAEERRAAIAGGPKPNCLVLDFAGNVRRHGPVDCVVVREPGQKGGGEAPVKECPDCGSYVHTAVRTCPDCGHEFPPPEVVRHEERADTIPILSTMPKVPALARVNEVPVTGWAAHRHEKWGSPDSLCVSYQSGLMSYREWVCFEHPSPMRFKAEKWWAKHGGERPPATVSEALERWDELQRPATISIRKNGRWFDIVGRSFRTGGQQGASSHERPPFAADPAAGGSYPLPGAA